MEIKQQEEKIITLKILLNNKTLRPLSKYNFRHNKGESYIDDVIGIVGNTEQYLQKGDILTTRGYTFQVSHFIGVNTECPRCVLTTTQYVPKKILNQIIHTYEPTKFIA